MHALNANLKGDSLKLIKEIIGDIKEDPISNLLIPAIVTLLMNILLY